VAGTPVDVLLARADELARRWAIALILALPLERIGELPLERFAREAPALCAQVVRALESDDELAQITARAANGSGHTAPVRRIAEITGARDGQAAVEVVEALRGVLWEALQEELCWARFEQSPARLVADLADRLAYVCSSALVSSLTQPAAAGEPAAVAPAAQAPAAQAPAVVELVPAAREQAIAPSQRSPLGNGVVIVDEGEAPQRSPAAVAGAPHELRAERVTSPASPSSAGAGARRARPRALPWDTPPRAKPSDVSDDPA
jgi:hypothetical protein